MCRYCCWQPLPGLFFKPSLIRSWLLMVIWETAHFLFVIYTAKCFQLLSSSAQFLSVCPSLCPLDKYHPPSFLSISHPNHAYTFVCAKPVYKCLPLCFYFCMFPFFSKFKIKFSIAESKIKINQSIIKGHCRELSVNEPHCLFALYWHDTVQVFLGWTCNQNLKQ